MDSSSFTSSHLEYPDAELLLVGGSTCDCFRVRRYGKLHFMKRLRPELATDPSHVAAMRKEFETGYALEHPNLVRYLDMDEDCLFMEYVDGLTLDRFCDENPGYFKKTEHIRRFTDELLSVLQYLHEHQIIHLDLKPANIMITRVGQRVKLVDLGFCYTDTYPDTTGLTTRWAAPEQIASKTLDARTDIYAFGRILEYVSKSPLWRKVAARCTQSDPDRRYGTAQEVAQDIITRYQRRKTILIAIAVIALMISVFFLGQRFSPSSPVVTTVPITDSVPTQPASVVSADSGIVASPDTTSLLVSTSMPDVTPSAGNVSAPSATEHNGDLPRLRSELAAMIAPVFERRLGHFRDSAWSKKTSELFSDAVLDFHHSFSWKDITQKYDPNYSRQTLEYEYVVAKYSFIYPVFWRMVYNQKHESYYKNLRFEPDRYDPHHRTYKYPGTPPSIDYGGFH